MRYHIDPVTVLPAHAAVHVPPLTVAVAVTLTPLTSVAFRVADVAPPVRILTLPHETTSGVGGAERKRPLAAETYVTPYSDVALRPLMTPILYQVLRVRVWPPQDAVHDAPVTVEIV